MSDHAGALRRYLGRLDGDDPGDPLELFADDVAFAINLPRGRHAGGRDELLAYLASRDAATPNRHHIVDVTTFGEQAVVLGESRDGDVVAGTFLMAATTGTDGRIARLLATFAPGLTFSTTETGS